MSRDDRGGIRFDPVAQQLLLGESPLDLRPKALAVLLYLGKRPDALVSKSELLEAVWPDTVVTESSLTGCINELRRAFGDDAAAPRFIETVHGRGYRFIGHIENLRSAESAPVMRSLLGRDAELEELHHAFRRASADQRQLVFIEGEPGIGKTTLIEAFITELRRNQAAPVQICRSPCSEAYGPSEPYVSLLTGLEDLCRGFDPATLAETMLLRAPMWLHQMPWLHTSAVAAALPERLAGTSPGRMARELSNFLAGTAADRTLLLILEDAHWADPSTLDAITALALGREPGHLLLVISYRPGDARLANNPIDKLARDLHRRTAATTLSLTPLTRLSVEQILARRFEDPELVTRLLPLVFRHAQGQPLFTENLVEYLVSRGDIRRKDGRWHLALDPATAEIRVPDTLREILEAQLGTLNDRERGILQVASVVGLRFTVPAIAAALPEIPPEEIETTVARFAAYQHFIEPIGCESWPDGTTCDEFSFRHAWYRDVLRQTVSNARHLQLCRRIGSRIEAACAGDTHERAHELAYYFEEGGDLEKAIIYLRQAADLAVHRYAHRDAIPYLNRALALLDRRPQGPERARQELEMLLTLGAAMSLTRGGSQPIFGELATRALRVGEVLGPSPELFMATFALHSFHSTRAELQTALRLAQQMLELAERLSVDSLIVASRYALGAIHMALGDLPTARADLEATIPLLVNLPTIQIDLGLLIWGHLGFVHSRSGLFGEDIACMNRALARSQQHDDPLNRAGGYLQCASLHAFRHDPDAAVIAAEQGLAHSIDDGYAILRATGLVILGWGRTLTSQTRVGLEDIQRGLDLNEEYGFRIATSLLLALAAEARLAVGDTSGAMQDIDNGLEFVLATGERWHEAELWRLKGEALAIRPRTLRDASTAEDYFRRAIETARRQGGRQLELRAANSLAAWLMKHGRDEEARGLLLPLHETFPADASSPDLATLRDHLGIDRQNLRATSPPKVRGSA